ncbi:MAG TPA: ATPase domain-containing protein [Candidatus Thermoplasmatota archaeon]|nr:ATPase domain-containing protein [Candidatus Thermoplasmatota archaeon]
MLPREVTQFLAEASRSLVVKGSAGAGKTLFALALARWYQLELGDVIWMNARDAEPGVVADLDDFVPPQSRIDASATLARSEETTASPMALIADLRQEVSGDERTLVVIDSVSALTDDVAPRERALFERSLTRLARERAMNMVLIVESTRSEPIEYLADGVVSLGEEGTPVGRLRVLRSQKLRGAPAALARHPFTLTEGAFWTPEPGMASYPETPVRAPTRPDVHGRLSTGTHAWDLILGGGLARGSVSLLEAPRAVGAFENVLVVPLMLNARALGRDVVTLLTAGESRAGMERWILPHLPPSPRGSLAIMEAGELVEEPRFGDKDATLDERLTRLERVRLRSTGPVVSVLSVDALLSAASREEAEAWLARWAFQTRQRGHVDVLVARPERAGLVATTADAHWRLDVWEGHVLARGSSPLTEPFFVHFHASRGFPETDLRRVQ